MGSRRKESYGYGRKGTIGRKTGTGRTGQLAGAGKEGRVKADGVVQKKAGAMVLPEAKLEVSGNRCPM